MAIAFARARYISRRSGGSAVRSAAYNAREGIRAEATGTLYYFAHRDGPAHHEVLLPEGASERLRAAGALWNAAEAAERRKDAQLAREIVLALPANEELTIEDRIALARGFALENFVSKGLAVQLDVHAPHTGETDPERANWHAHLLITTRRVEGEGFCARKARDLEPEVRRVGGRAVVSEGEAWGVVWRDLQNRYFAEQGLTIRVDQTGAVPQSHIGPIRMRAPEAEANLRALEIAGANAAAARDVGSVLEVLTRNTATFSERDVERYLSKHIPDREERAEVTDNVLGSREVLALYDGESGEGAARFTTRAVRAQEEEALGHAEALASSRGVRVSERAGLEALAGRALKADQLDAYRHALDRGGLKIIEGRAGTGKSFVLSAIREAHERRGFEVIGLAPTNAVAQDLRANGFARANTVHSELFRLKNGMTQWIPDTVLVVDEAAMLDSRVTGELLGEARRAGAKVIFAGDDRQLASIERGGLFAEMKARHGSATITEVTRQASDWQRQAARDLAEGRFEEALSAFAREGAITWRGSQEEAQAALVARWRGDSAERPDASRFVFAYTNADVDRLNAALRDVRRERGELGRDHAFETKHGVASFAVGDRVQFTDTLKAARIYNGNAATITAIEAGIGLIRARLDAPIGAEPREVTWSSSEFSGFRHGYAGTIYKGQGKTIDETYLFHTHHWRQAASYVALTRQRERAQLFVATEVAKDLRALARQMGRNEVKAASVSYATYDELSPEQRVRADRESERFETREAVEARRPDTGDHVSPTREASVRRDAPAEIDKVMVAPEPLIPAFKDPQGRDSLGRSLDAASLRAAIEADGRVQMERQDQDGYLAAAYRKPREAGRVLDALVARDGTVSAARRVEAEPTVLGELKGKVGLLASAVAKAERAQAITVTGALADNVRRLGDREARAEQDYRGTVEAQMKADAVVVPQLSAEAEEALAKVAAARTAEDKAAAFEAARAGRSVGAELRSFAQAFQQRFGDDVVRDAMRRGERAPVPKSLEAGIAKDAFSNAARAFQHIEVGERARSRVQAERLEANESLKQGSGLRM